MTHSGRRWLLLGTSVMLVAGVVGVFVRLDRSGSGLGPHATVPAAGPPAATAAAAPGEPGARPRAAAEVGPLTFTVDRALRPSVQTVGPVDGTTGRRPVGALAEPDGSVAELVLDEVIVHVRDGAQLQAFLGRWAGRVVDSFDPDADGQDHLVRVDPSRADPGRLPADLLATEPHQAGRHRVSDDRVLRLLALAAAEWRAGTEVVVDWLTEPAGIADGKAFESEDIVIDADDENSLPKNVFDWSFMRTGGGMDTGVAAAWQLLQAHDRLTPRVRYMVFDGGFNPNFDFPKNSKIRKAKWGDKNGRDCTNGTSCPYHGTDVVLAGMGTVDNRYGTAGPAGPVVSQLVAVGNDVSDYWSGMRRIEKVAEEEHPDVVNLSFTRDVNTGSKHAQKWTDRRMQHVQRTGALIVAAAGNNGKTVDSDTLYIPCESKYVMCVGGMTGGGKLDVDSNYGQGDSRRSVEIYGPMCVRSVNDPNRSALDFTTKRVCGTSLASPFVGGVAALVLAADPDLGAEEVRRILNDTANVGGLGSKATGSQRRVNALQAVARALGVDVVPPAVTIETPTNGADLGVEDWVDLRGRATDFMGRAVPIHWVSDRDGALADRSTTTVQPLSVGTHVLTATATDTTGRASSAKVTVTVADAPPKVGIGSPPAGLQVLEGTAVALVATTLDPDTWSPVPDSVTAWEVRRGGTVVHTATGHHAALPAWKVTPGSYAVRFTAGGVAAERSFTVAAVPPGQTKPVAAITKPYRDSTVGAHNGAPQAVAFAGSGTDVQDGIVAGTRYRWVAYSATETKVLCVDSNVPSSGKPGGIVVARNCAAFTATLGLAKGDLASTTWTVWLEVVDSTTLVGRDSVDVTIQYVTG